MAVEVVMPQMGESIVEGTITRWLKQVGDAVRHDEPLFEISTDKVDAEIPSPAEGVLVEIRFAQGETVQVNTVVAVIASADEAVAAPVAEAAVVAQSAPAAAAQGIEVVMPQMGESIVEGTITRWLKKPGDAVRHDEPLFEISTDKVDAEIPSPAEGVLAEIRAQEGDTVLVNSVVAVIAAPGAVLATPATESKTAPQPAAAQSAAAPLPDSLPPIDPSRKLRSSPLVRRMAKEHNIDLRRVPGTGSEGRINKADVLRYLSQPATSRPRTAPPAAAASVPAEELIGKTVPVTKMRAIIAERMLESKRTAPHAHTVYKVDMTRIARLRARERGAFERQHGVKLTYMPFIARSMARTLLRYPVLNSSLVEGAIQYHLHVNLGIAVALEWGLIVPVVRHAEQKSFVELARSIADLAERARSKKLLPDEVAGSTFTLTNSGVFGGEFGTPILNQPEAAILAIGGLKKEPVVLTDAEGNDTLAIRSMQYFCLGFDHRTIDGADSGKFMSELKQALEQWDEPLS